MKEETWKTAITKVEPNKLLLRGYRIDELMGRITYVGAGFLAIIAIIPTLVAGTMQIPFMVSAFLGGTGLLIVVSVTLDVVQRIEAGLIMRNYKGFLGDEGPIKGARA